MFRALSLLSSALITEKNVSEVFQKTFNYLNGEKNIPSISNMMSESSNHETIETMLAFDMTAKYSSINFWKKKQELFTLQNFIMIPWYIASQFFPGKGDPIVGGKTFNLIDPYSRGKFFIYWVLVILNLYD